MAITEILRSTATIANAANLSDAIDCGTGNIEGIILPAIDSAAITFQGSADGSTFLDIYDATGSEVSIPASTGNRAYRAPDALKGFAYIKIRTGTSAVPVAQTAARSIVVVIK